MPYRRLPTTDKARIRALDIAVKISAKNEDKKLAFPEHYLEELKVIKLNFENGLLQYEADLKKQSEKNKEYREELEKTVMYISHFIKVLFMTLERGEIKEEALNFYGLLNLDKKIPQLATEEEILKWGNKIIEGEQKRIQKGGSPIYSPSIALVKMRVERFNDVAIFMQNLRKITDRSYNKIKALRKTTNDFISSLWTEIEENIKSDTPKHKRQQAQEYGVVYVFRRKEKKKLGASDLQTDLIFDFG